MSLEFKTVLNKLFNLSKSLWKQRVNVNFNNGTKLLLELLGAIMPMHYICAFYLVYDYPL